MSVRASSIPRSVATLDQGPLTDYIAVRIDTPGFGASFAKGGILNMPFGKTVDGAAFFDRTIFNRAAIVAKAVVQTTASGTAVNAAGFAIVSTDVRAGAAFPGGGDVFAALFAQDVFGDGNLSRGFAVNGDEDAALVDTALVALGFELRNAHADQCAYQATNCAAYSEPGECAHDGTGGDERTDSRDSERSDSGEQAQGSADDPADTHAGGSALRRLGVLFRGKLLRMAFVGHQDGYILVGEPGRCELVDCAFCRFATGEDSESCCVFTCHFGSPESCCAEVIAWRRDWWPRVWHRL